MWRFLLFGFDADGNRLTLADKETRQGIMNLMGSQTLIANLQAKGIVNWQMVNVFVSMVTP